MKGLVDVPVSPRSEEMTGENAELDQKQSCADRRRQQVLDAAAECFRRYGFHGASIAQISKTAGMSSGHIYHFFPGKEAIIGALVERKVCRAIESAEYLEQKTDIFEALLDKTERGLEENTEPEEAALWLEIWAEAARNPEVAEVVRREDAVIKAHVLELEDRARRARGLTSRVDPDAAAEVIMALFKGLSVRAVLNPELDKEEIAKVMRIVIRTILES